MLVEDPAIDEALAWYATAKWKNKASAGRAAASLPSFAYVLRERDPELARQVFEHMLQSGVTEGGGKIEVA